MRLVLAGFVLGFFFGGLFGGALVLGRLSAIDAIHPHPTADELYGCTVAQQAPNGECK